MSGAPHQAPTPDRFIAKIGCVLVAIPVGAFIVVTTADALNIPPGGVLLASVVVLLIANGLGSGGRTASTAATSSDSHHGPRRHAPPRRSAYEQMREIVERYESGAISAERRDELIRDLRR
jgi:hypothetical protein